MSPIAVLSLQLTYVLKGNLPHIRIHYWNTIKKSSSYIELWALSWAAGAKQIGWKQQTAFTVSSSSGKCDCLKIYDYRHTKMMCFRTSHLFASCKHWHFNLLTIIYRSFCTEAWLLGTAVRVWLPVVPLLLRKIQLFIERSCFRLRCEHRSWVITVT